MPFKLQDAPISEQGQVGQVGQVDEDIGGIVGGIKGETKPEDVAGTALWMQQREPQLKCQM